jgi:alkyldihydroxyacetonephosphate synthase
MTSADIIADLRSLLGKQQVIDEPVVLTAYATDTWPLRLTQAAVGGARRERPLCVVRPASTHEVAACMRYLYSREVPVVPRGGGSGVQGGAEPPEGSVVLDVGQLNAILHLDRDRLSATAQAGVGQAKLEAWLNERGYISGHYPQSIDQAQVGGLIATRSSGQYSTRYGSIEDLVLGLEVVLADGSIVRVGSTGPRRAAGPDLRNLFIGSEGAFGVITEATLRVFPAPEETWMAAFSVPDMHGGLAMLRDIVQPGWRPAVLRLYDPIEAERAFGGQIERGSCLLLALSEGPADLPTLEGANVNRIVQAAGARPLGPEPVSAWLRNRNDVSAFYKYVQAGMIVDTIDVSAAWDRLADVYAAVVAALRKEVRELVAVSAHASHCYPQGANLYFVVGAQPPHDPAEVERVYERIWSVAMETVLGSGGSICHHHGIGKLRTRWLEPELGSAYGLLERLKVALDPQGLMNPGTLLPTRMEECR